MKYGKLTTLGALLATLVLAGCGASGTDADPGAPAAAAAQPEAGAGVESDAGTATGGYADEGYACGLITRADLETFYGGPVGEPEPKSVGDSRFCDWAGAPGGTDSYVFLWIEKPIKGVRGDANTEYDELRSKLKGDKAVKDVAGLGEKAMSDYYPGATRVRIVVEDMYITIGVQYVLGKRTLTPEADVARVTTLAKQVVGRM
ncbi:uncharacterized protein DUF3558 [Krasilnikovia cinnamomea]|uniref:Uncharacterized protein DUF3558 n=1 Tax=Krasilnikovia cinnamomea TaxID=349313 RepID=A0A4V2G7R2_9ACTN|nr:DUF3558 family protein [Krasilnikovia cinnamomea]RZU53616.1 uncharacterized protein DUF3558 [Krasilnikovia cinnamomea]